MDRLKELINCYQQSVDYLAENWNITTRHMEMGELREYKEHCQIEDDTLTYLKELQHYKDLEEQGRLICLPCAIGDTVYRICPKCNDEHNGSCKNCAWIGCFSNSGCNTYGLWSDGQFPPEECTIVPYKVFWNYIPNLLENYGKTVFLTKEEAEAKLKELKGE